MAYHFFISSIQRIKNRKGTKKVTAESHVNFNWEFTLNLNPPCDATIRFFDVSGTTGAYINLKRLFTQLKTCEYHISKHPREKDKIFKPFQSSN